MSLLAVLSGFIFLIALLSTLRARLVYEVSGTSLLVFGTTKPGVILYSIFFLPGTIIHELSHWIVAEILQVRTGEITIFPDLDDLGETRRLGSVATEKTDPVRGFLIGVAPFVTGLAILMILGSLLILEWNHFVWWKVAFLVYGIMVIGNSMMISKEDRRTWPVIIVILALVTTLISKYYPTAVLDHEASLISLLTPLNLVLGMTAGLNLVMIVGSYSLRKLAERLTKKRVIRR